MYNLEEMPFAEALKILRGELTGLQVAERALPGKSDKQRRDFANYLSRIERKRVKSPSLARITQISQGLGYSTLKDFFGAIEALPPNGSVVAPPKSALPRETEHRTHATAKPAVVSDHPERRSSQSALTDDLRSLMQTVGSATTALTQAAQALKESAIALTQAQRPPDDRQNKGNR